MKKHIIVAIACVFGVIIVVGGILYISRVQKRVLPGEFPLNDPKAEYRLALAEVTEEFNPELDLEYIREGKVVGRVRISNESPWVTPDFESGWPLKLYGYVDKYVQVNGKFFEELYNPGALYCIAEPCPQSESYMVTLLRVDALKIVTKPFPLDDGAASYTLHLLPGGGLATKFGVPHLRYDNHTDPPRAVNAWTPTDFQWRDGKSLEDGGFIEANQKDYSAFDGKEVRVRGEYYCIDDSGSTRTHKGDVQVCTDEITLFIDHIELR